MSYITVLGKYFPTVQAHCIGDDSIYTNLVWDGGDALPSQATLDALFLSELKEQKIHELSEACKQSILDGFISSALGQSFKYDAEDVDQINLLGATTATAPTAAFPNGTDIQYAVRPMVNGVPQAKYYTLHTHAQLRQVLSDGATYKLTCLQHFNELRDDVGAAADEAAVAAIVWTTPF